MKIDITNLSAAIEIKNKINAVEEFINGIEPPFKIEVTYRDAAGKGKQKSFWLHETDEQYRALYEAIYNDAMKKKNDLVKALEELQ